MIHTALQAGGTGQTRLYNICKAYSVYDEEIGYCQGLSFVAAVLLLHMPEEEAFCLFIKLMYDYRVRDMFKDSFSDLQLKYYQLTRLVEELLPDLSAHFKDLGVEVHMYATQWFLTVFTAKFSLCTAYQILDVFLSEGHNVLFHIAIGILKLCKKDLLDCDFEDAMRYFRVDVPRNFDTERSAAHLVSVAMRMKITEKKLKRYEADYLEVKAAEMASQDPLTRAEEENSRLQANAMRLETENGELAHTLVTSKVNPARCRRLAWQGVRTAFTITVFKADVDLLPLLSRDERDMNESLPTSPTNLVFAPLVRFFRSRCKNKLTISMLN